MIQRYQLIITSFVQEILYIRQMNQQKKIKLIISSLKQKELIQFFQIYCEYHIPDLRKSVKKISYNCYQAALQHRHIFVNGYGKNYNEALASGADNFLDKLLQDQKNHNNLRQSLKKFSVMFNIATLQPLSSQKMKTLPDSSNQKKVGSGTKLQDCALKPKENMMKSVKTIKQQIFESLNHENIQIKPAYSYYPHQLNKNSSYSMLGQGPSRNQQLSTVMTRIKELQQKLAQAESQNDYLKNRLKEKELKSSQQMSSNSKFQKYHIQQPKIIQKESYLKDVSNKFNNTSNSQDVSKEQTKTRSYSLSNSINPSAFNSKAGPKVKIPKLNLEVLPNYHGKSNKSLNQSLLQTYQKKLKASQNNN